MQNNLYQWPCANAIYPDRGNKSYRFKRLRFRLRSLMNLRSVQAFEQYVNQNPDLAAFLNTRANYSYPLVHRFLDKRFNAKQRYQAMVDNLTFLPKSLWQQSISFGEVVPEFSLYLNINEQQPMEGFWALELRHSETHQLIYVLTFGKLADSLLIAVIQGPNFDGSKELVKKLTKKCHGLRPAYLMVECMKALTRVLGYSTLLGIPQKYQNKSRLIQSKRYVVDYDAIFRESGASLAEYWLLPLALNNKDLSDIPSNKRSMYRKRYAMLEQIQAAMHEQLAGLQAVHIEPKSAN
ncbi:hypothetical protein F544_17270 [Bibersteinia trehalosi USDA-ARS-USMARC-190]|uniref:DUF535 domain-containing protein n=1 Tax=Bibersteinia trehalosi USDA-ARS-USMARC-190 TaxID=1263832 RepID=W0R9G7_BIBTR|nr:VirK/YbjX family protein [Bibersteinia trehalosi]AHG86955.1 hypothetical protein F544_17270 [Bibersteinia trehalosi USDA-ARS-USMARC-190]